MKQLEDSFEILYYVPRKVTIKLEDIYKAVVEGLKSKGYTNDYTKLDIIEEFSKYMEDYIALAVPKWSSLDPHNPNVKIDETHIYAIFVYYITNLSYLEYTME